MTATRSRIVGVGSYLPEKILTNADLTSLVDTSDDWIVQRTGIRQRHIAADTEKTSDLALAAARQALEAAGMVGNDLDLIVLATATPDHTFPATATRVQAALGMTRGMAYDVQAVCSGFVYALTLADNHIRLGQARRALVIGAETFSRILDWDDRSTCVLFGDGAGAVVLAAETGFGTYDDFGVLTTHLHSDGRFHDMLYVDGGPSSTGVAGKLRMQGREVFKHAVSKMSEVIDEALATTGFSPEQINWVVPHQANRRIIEATTKKLGIPMSRVIVTVDRHANTSAASIPLALAEGVGDGRIRRGDLVLLEAMGGGFTWASALIRW